MFTFWRNLITSFKKPPKETPLPWQILDTKWQWDPPGKKVKVELNNGLTGWIYAVDLRDIMLYDNDNKLIGTFPKEAMIRILEF